MEDALSTKHATWSLERHYPVPPARVFGAWANPAVKIRWFMGEAGDATPPYTNDFRVGGIESVGSAPGVSPAYTYEAVYRDIVEDERIVSTYEMSVDERRISVSVATVELFPSQGGTRLVYTESGVYLDDLDQPEYREQGTADHLDRLAQQLTSVEER